MANNSTLSLDEPTTEVRTDYTCDLWDRQGDLQTVTATRAANTYADAAGNRVAELTSGGTSTYYLIDANNPTGYAQELEEAATQGGTPTAAFAFGNQLIAQEKAGTLNYLLTDGHGSTRILTDAAGTVLETYTYDAYGDAVAFFRYAADGTPTAIDATTAGTTHLYSAEQFDAVSGFYNQRARWYTTSDGRFTSADTYMGRNVDPLSLHKYLYGSSNPILNVDPSGNFSLVELAVNTAVSSLLASITSVVLKPALSYLVKDLIPERWLAAFRELSLDALMVGGAVTATGGYAGASIGLTGGGELLMSTHNAHAAFYLYGGWTIGAVGATSYSVGANVKVGAVYGIHSSSDYEGRFFSVSVPITALPQDIRNKISRGLGKYVQSSSFENYGRPIREVLAENPQWQMSSILPKVQSIVNRINDLSVSVFWGPDAFYPCGFDFEYTAASVGNTGALNIAGTWYKQMVPYNSPVSF